MIWSRCLLLALASLLHLSCATVLPGVEQRGPAIGQRSVIGLGDNGYTQRSWNEIVNGKSSRKDEDTDIWYLHTFFSAQRVIDYDSEGKRREGGTDASILPQDYAKVLKAYTANEKKERYCKNHEEAKAISGCEVCVGVIPHDKAKSNPKELDEIDLKKVRGVAMGKLKWYKWVL